jgi:ADP-ribosyl-[dinitrogen reductase] hydrolase
MVSLEDKIRGMFLGVQIGDVFGLCVESWTAEKIADEHGRITEYQHNPKRGKPGCFSDDTALTLSVASSIIESRGLDMDSQAKHHIAALQDTAGWGSTTKEAVRRLANGCHWSKSGLCGVKYGRGNGTAMKISPVAAYAISTKNDVLPFVVSLSMMTHATSIATSAALSQFYAITYCLETQPEEFLPGEFIESVCRGSIIGESHLQETINDRLTERLNSLRTVVERSNDDIIKQYGGGSCYCYDSLPFTYAFFLRNLSIEAIYDVVSSGGDTDSNASMLASLLGSLYGQSIFPEHLKDCLNDNQAKSVRCMADQFLALLCVD